LDNDFATDNGLMSNQNVYRIAWLIINTLYT